jgi:hypothetical protein
MISMPSFLASSHRACHLPIHIEKMMAKVYNVVERRSHIPLSPIGGGGGGKKKQKIK